MKKRKFINFQSFLWHTRATQIANKNNITRFFSDKALKIVRLTIVGRGRGLWTEFFRLGFRQGYDKSGVYININNDISQFVSQQIRCPQLVKCQCPQQGNSELSKTAIGKLGPYVRYTRIATSLTVLITLVLLYLTRPTWCLLTSCIIVRKFTRRSINNRSNIRNKSDFGEVQRVKCIITHHLFQSRVRQHYAVSIVRCCGTAWNPSQIDFVDQNDLVEISIRMHSTLIKACDRGTLLGCSTSCWSGCGVDTNRTIY